MERLSLIAVLAPIASQLTGTTMAVVVVVQSGEHAAHLGRGLQDVV